MPKFDRLLPLLALAALPAAAAPPTFSYFDPPIAPAGATVTLHGQNLSGFTKFSVVSTATRIPEASATFSSDTQIQFTVPSGDDNDDGVEFFAMIATPEGVCVTVPIDAPIITGEELPHEWNPLEPILVATARPPIRTEVYEQAIFLETGAHVDPGTPGGDVYFFLKAGSTLDYSNADFGTRHMFVYREPGSTLIGPGPIFGPEFPPVFTETPVINAARIGPFVRDPTPPTANITVTQTPDGSVAINPTKPTYHIGELATFTASPDEGSSFLDWAPPYSGQPNPLELKLIGSTSISAQFTTGFTVETEPTTSGTITLEPSLPRYQQGQQVTATFTPLPGHAFTGWSGTLTSTENPLTFSLDANATLAVHATPPPELQQKWSWAPSNLPEEIDADEDHWTEIAILPDGTLVVGYVPTQQIPNHLSLNGTLFAISPAGGLVWSKDLLITNGTGFNSRRPYLLAPAITPDGNIIVGAGTSYYGFDGDGNTLWQRKFQTSGVGGPRDGIIYHVAVSESAHSLVPFDGERFIMLSPDGVTTASLIIDDSPTANITRSSSINDQGVIIAAANSSDILYLDEALNAVAPPSPSPGEAGGIPQTRFPPTVGLHGSHFQLFNGIDSTSLVHFPTDGSSPEIVQGAAGIRIPPILAQDNSLVFPDGSGNLVCLEADDFTPRWSIPGFSNSSAIAAADGSVYAVGADPKRPAVYKISSDGTILGHFPLITDPSAPDLEAQLEIDIASPDPIPLLTLALAPDGTLYSASRDGTLYAIEGTAPLATSSWPKAFGNIDNASRVHPLAPAIDSDLTADISDPGTIILSFAHRARPAATVQWFLDDQPVPGESSNTLTIERPNSSNLGSYFARITNSAGTVDTATVDLQINFAISLTPTPGVEVTSSHSGQPIPPGTEVTLTATPAPGYDFVRWSGDIDATENPLQLTVDQSLVDQPASIDG